MNILRFIKHFGSGPWLLRRKFSQGALNSITEQIKQSENLHRGEIRFCAEASLEISDLLRGKTAYQRALEVFSELRTWDTEENTGVLIYLLLADRELEIIADRGINKLVPQGNWEKICRKIEIEFAKQCFPEGISLAIKEITSLLSEHFPASSANQNELGNEPLLR